MDKGYLQEKLTLRVPLREIATETGKSLGSVRHWVKKYGLVVKNGVGARPRPFPGHCPRCEEVKEPSFFYHRKNGKRLPYCISCTKEQTLERQRAFKKEAVEYKGGKCVLCGYDRYQGALEFHHLEPEHKDFHLSQRRNWKFTAEVRQELDKCVCVCANCHREAHAGLSAPGRI